MESQLEFPQSAILTPYNYFEWKPKIQFDLRIRGLFRITMETEVEPTSAIEKSRYFNRMDEAFGILCLSISPELLIHVETCSTPNEVWKLLEGLFGKQDEIWQSFLFSLGHTNEERSVKFDEDISHAPVDEANSASADTEETRSLTDDQDSNLLPATGDIVWVDRERMLIKCEPMVCMSEVSAAVLPLGMAPQVLPELDDLTVGGVINGYGIEGSSHLFGLFSDTCVAYELVLADGSLVRVTADNEYSDLFHAVPWSHGSIGLLVGAEFRLTPVKEYMKVTYSPVTGTLDDIASHYLKSFRLPQNDYEEKVPDFVETMIFNDTNAVITTGRYASREEATRKGNVINEIGWWYKAWFHTHVATALKRGKFVEYVPAREYHHRHTRSLYWEGALIVPMGNHPLFRFFLGWLMPPKVSLLKLTMTSSLRNYYEQRHACQDMLIPSRKVVDCLKFCHDNFETYPLWLCPHRLPKKRMGTMLDCEPEYEKDMQAGDTEEAQMWTDVGIWTVPLPVLRNEVWDGVEATKSMEKWLRDNGSYQCLYAVVEQSEEEFWQMFDRTLYDAVRKKYGAEGNFMSVYYKISKSKKGQAYSNGPSSLKKLQ